MPQAPEYDVVGPMFVEFKIKTSPTSTSTRSMSAIGLDFKGQSIVVYFEGGATIIPDEAIIEVECRTK